ncbi:MAG TPA: stage III sporulation protein AA [Sphingobacteriaceae bacterium]|nr:stage III sporulation protein AA [Sphingobacteriaceae bacterium]
MAASPVDYVWRQEIAPHLAPPVRRVLDQAPAALLARAVELRLRAGGPLQLVLAAGDVFLDHRGRPCPPAEAYRISGQVLADCWQAACRGSVYAWEEETRQGFLTLPGGHRLGLAGRFAVENGRVLRLRHVGGIAVRLCRAVPGCADPVLPSLVDRKRGTVHHTLIYSPPGAGKTTLLRDLVRQISTGVPALGLPGRRVAVIDERSEVAACREGAAQHDLGPRTDVLDGVPKAEGILMALRALNPEVIAFDEIGHPAEAEGVLAALYAGVRVITTAHGSSRETLARRPALRELAPVGVFARFVRLAYRRGPGFVAAVEGGARG